MVIKENRTSFENMDFAIENIRSLPTIIDGCHESCFRSYHVMNYIKDMVTRGDSKETILMVIENFGLHQTDEYEL
jgi:hypothetical protein